ncbi:TPA: hypothetical protein ACJKLK_001236 [Acinetobacter baumannii]
MTDLNKERELYMAAKARIEKEEFFCRDWDLWKACAELKQAEINELRAELEKAKAQAVPETHVVVPKGVLDLTRFMCKTWAEIDNFVYKNCTNLGEYPVIQGTSNQFNLAKIGNQKVDNNAIHSAVKWFLESESGAEG